MNEERILEKLDPRFDAIDKKLVSQDEQLGFMRQHMVTREEFYEAIAREEADHGAIREEIENRGRATLEILEHHSVMLKRLDDERLSTTEWIRRVDEDLSLLKTRVDLG
ncbi:MAG: hypothetical protein HYZ08_03000 [Candidatus Kerfeldbacteria bacterium]|nr:hypothetical protein [Candidatus Kerfeldbacteria bacterium]